MKILDLFVPKKAMILTNFSLQKHQKELRLVAFDIEFNSD